MSSDSLSRQIAFIVEADRLKTIIRRTPLTDNSRLENSAEHSWHLAVAAIALREHAPSSVDLARVLEMVAIHDLVEIDAGDTFAYDIAAHHDKADRERLAAERIFGLLPIEQADRLHTLWEEFEAAETLEARYANALDRVPGVSAEHALGWRQLGHARCDACASARSDGAYRNDATASLAVRARGHRSFLRVRSHRRF